MLIKVGNPDEFPKPPSWFPKCGGYDYQPKESLKASQGAAPKSDDPDTFPVVYVLVGAGLLITMLLGVIAILGRKLYSRRTGYTRLRT